MLTQHDAHILNKVPTVLTNLVFVKFVAAKHPHLPAHCQPTKTSFLGF